MKHDCEVCRGRGKITLPLYKPMTVMASPDMDNEISVHVDDTRRDYACPECAPVAQENKIFFLDTSADVDARWPSEPGLVASVHKKLAQQLADGLLERNMLTISEGRKDKSRDVTTYYARVGAVSPDAVESLEKKIAKQQRFIAAEVIERATKDIRNWGSHFDHGVGPIEKDRAIEKMRTALDMTIEKHQKN